MIYLNMLLTFMKISLFSFGGGYAILAMIQQEVVVKHSWLTLSEFQDIVAISQMTPGPIAINAATYIGYKEAGFLGSLICTIGVILPSVLIMLAISLSYNILRDRLWFKAIFRELRLLAVGLVAAAAILIAQGALTDIFSIVVFVVVLLIAWFYKPNPVLVMLGAGLLGFFLG
ncbi:MAG: chromate transporter [Candidatus Cloacimonetes bacterium HGW-Cloacimonetes-2]|nr:MAG: chromate transporter [Candidatus Cloacimonetes bacterium HGW-Cloacimonetes-2]